MISNINIVINNIASNGKLKKKKDIAIAVSCLPLMPTIIVLGPLFPSVAIQTM